MFDVDDTLYLETDYVASGFGAVDAHLRVDRGIMGFLESATRRFAAGARGDVFDLALADLGVEDARQLVPDLVTTYREHAPSITLLADARAALDRCSARGRVAVITDGPEASQRAKVVALDLARWAWPIVLTAAYGDGYGKPNRRAFSDVAAAHGDTQLAYVADNPAKDFVAPAQLGWRTVRLRRIGGLHAAVPSGTDVEHEITDLDHLDDVLA